VRVLFARAWGVVATMPRNLSFALTTPQFLARTKTVTRRNGWRFLKAGDILCGVEKSQGLGKGGKIKRLGYIRVTGVRREKLNEMVNRIEYGKAECALEGFPAPHPYSCPFCFVECFCGTHKGIRASSRITRIEFEYIDGEAV
jgi:hypothetical protein